MVMERHLVLTTFELEVVLDAMEHLACDSSHDQDEHAQARSDLVDRILSFMGRA